MNDEKSLDNEIIIHGRNLNKIVTALGTDFYNNNIKVMIGDITDEMILSDEKIDYVVHAAMPSDSDILKNNPISVFESAVLGTQNIIKLCNKCNVQSLVYISSVTIYGNCDDNHPIDESYFDKQDWKNDADAYMMGKRSAEFMLPAECRHNRLPVKILRPGFVYGANKFMDSRVYNCLIAKAALGEDIILNSDGLLSRQMVYMLDVVKAILAALVSKKNGEAYNISGADVTLRLFAEKLAEVSNRNVLYANQDDAGKSSLNKPNTISVEKAFNELEWSTDVSLDEALEEAVEIYKEMYVI